jgi:hypothetical protein
MLNESEDKKPKLIKNFEKNKISLEKIHKF